MKRVKLFEQFINESDAYLLINEGIAFDNTLYKKVLKAIAATKTYLDIENEGDMYEIFLSTRENGDVGSETPGREDIKEVQRVQKILQKKFAKDDIKVTVSTTGEFVNLQIQKLKPIEYGYGYKVFEQGKTDWKSDAGGNSFSTFEELVDELESDYIDGRGPGYALKGVNWKAVKKELDSITEFPKYSYATEMYSSKLIPLAMVGEFGNERTRDVYVYKEKSQK